MRLQINKMKDIKGVIFMASTIILSLMIIFIDGFTELLLVIMAFWIAPLLLMQAMQVYINDKFKSTDAP
jgi:hypothetical protein